MSSNQRNRRNGPKRSVIRLWNLREEEDIAHYMASTPYLGKDQAKETLAQYEKRMLADLKIENCDVKKLNNKITSMKKKYEEVKKWISETGQGVKENDPASFRDVVCKKCPYFYILDEFLSSSQSINTTYQRSNGIVTVSEEQNTDNCLELSAHSNYQSPTDLLVQMEQGIPDGTIEDSVDAPPNENEENQMSPLPKMKKYSKFITNIQEKSGKRTSALQQLNSIFNSKQESKAQIEEKKLLWEMEKWNTQQQLDQQRLEEDRAHKLRVVQLETQADIRKAELLNEIELKKIALEEKKLEVEKMKLKMQNPNTHLT